MTVPSAAARRAALAARGSALCVFSLFALALALSPEGTVVAFAFLGFLLLPSLFGAAVLARGAQRTGRGAQPLAQLVAGAVLLLPGAFFVLPLGLDVLTGHELVGRSAVIAWACLVLAPPALVLGAAAPVLLWSRPHLDAVRVIGWANVVVLVLAGATALSWVEASTG